MTGFDTRWERHPEIDEEQNIIMIVYFRPDKLPEDKAEWFKILGNYAHTMAEMIKAGTLPNEKTEDLIKRGGLSEEKRS
ncbi:hypothetical protein J7L97_02560 [Candidatus Bathyarchaeota archaeon]|nr:hypothetical protein [Candidatus Bathyarchaeota archaeon]